MLLLWYQKNTQYIKILLYQSPTENFTGAWPNAMQTYTDATIIEIQYNTMENLHSKTDKHTVSLI